MTRSEIARLRRLFKRNRGEQYRLAKRLDIAQVTLSRWFQGQVTSARIEAAVMERATELLKAEEETRKAKLGEAYEEEQLSA